MSDRAPRQPGMVCRVCGSPLAPGSHPVDPADCCHAECMDEDRYRTALPVLRQEPDAVLARIVAGTGSAGKRRAATRVLLERRLAVVSADART